MLKNANNHGQILDTEHVLEKYQENIELIQKLLNQLEQDVSNLQSEGLVEIEKLANDLSMLQKLSTSIEIKAKCFICNHSETIETSKSE
ncbi:hypothetical protein FC756_14325 [Lysinibacillus mangiferihumi]|uniref:Uncharacterized protein n=1 Tax=Lysinibacillus mangiferihumi TaxID=1130819 RepID=A0A4V5TL96_9BACI|nr:hypothetical protein [Lysinibacillus mangiferihumi]TKI66903.1 hypothetical protein FC756_14325 [Lysinibacillus mangiferihumi]